MKDVNKTISLIHRVLLFSHSVVFLQPHSQVFSTTAACACSFIGAESPGTGVCGVQWNTGSPELLAVVLSSGGLYVLEVKEDVKVVASQAEMGATCCE